MYCFLWSDWANKLNIMVPSGEVPDIFVTYGPGDPDSFERLALDGLLLSLSPYLNDYPNIREKLKGRENHKLGDDYYAIPVALPKSDHVGMIRGDWLDQLGLQAPQTIDELYQAAIAFKKAFNIFPVSSSPPHTAGFFWLNTILYAFGGGWDTWLEDGQGGYVMCWISDGNRRALKFINRLYREGLLDQEFFSNTDTQKMDRFLSSKAGIVFHNNISLYTDKLRSIDPDARIDIFNPLKGPDEQQGQWAMDGFFTAVSIHSNISEEKRYKSLELLDFLCSPEGLELLRYGVKDVRYKEENGCKAPLILQENGIYKRLREVDKTAAEKKYKKQLTDMVFQEYVSLVQSDRFDEDWEAFVRKWYEYGGQEMTEERNR